MNKVQKKPHKIDYNLLNTKNKIKKQNFSIKKYK